MKKVFAQPRKNILKAEFEKNAQVKMLVACEKTSALNATCVAPARKTRCYHAGSISNQSAQTGQFITLKVGLYNSFCVLFSQSKVKLYLSLKNELYSETCTVNLYYLFRYI